MTDPTGTESLQTQANALAESARQRLTAQTTTLHLAWEGVAEGLRTRPPAPEIQAAAARGFESFLAAVASARAAIAPAPGSAAEAPETATDRLAEAREARERLVAAVGALSDLPPVFRPFVAETEKHSAGVVDALSDIHWAATLATSPPPEGQAGARLISQVAGHLTRSRAAIDEILNPQFPI